MKHLIYQGLISFLIAGFIAVNAPSIIRTWNGHTSLERWFIVRQLEVDKFTKYGNYPVLYYDRTFFQDFSADWSATIQKIDAGGTFSFYCSGSGHNDYKAGTQLPKEQLDIRWIVKNDPSCDNLKNSPGEYRVVVTWTNIDRGPYYYLTKKEIVTNVFKILEPGVEIDEQAAAN